jgi:hypothetical protein
MDTAGPKCGQDGIPRVCVWISGYHLCLHPRASATRLARPSPRVQRALSGSEPLGAVKAQDFAVDVPVPKQERRGVGVLGR